MTDTLTDEEREAQEIKKAIDAERHKDVRILPTPYDVKDRRISRHGAMNTAIAIVALGAHNPAWQEGTTDEDIQRLLTRWADWVLAYVNEAPQS